METRKGFIAEGTTCDSCAEIIKRQAMKIEGVKEVEFNISNEVGYVTFEDTKTNMDEILFKIEEKGYKCFILDEDKDNTETVRMRAADAHTATKRNSNWLGWAFGIIGILIIGYFAFSFVEGINMPEISHGMGYGLLFAAGILTGFHCIAMCGGFVVGYTARDAQNNKKSHLSHIKYGVGKTLSYTAIAAIFGLIGSIIAFTPTVRGVAGIIAGIFLIFYGLRTLNIIPVLRKIRLMPKSVSRIVGEKTVSSNSPLLIGLFNGLMIACGPLQAIYIMAAGTGSAIEGAKIGLIFALGTLPAMLGFGYFASMISSKATQKILKFSGLIVIVLGLIMINNGLVITGKGWDAKSITDNVNPLSSNSGISDGSAGSNSANVAVQKEGYQEIRMDVTSKGWEPNSFVLKSGVPVHWIINGKTLNGCNNAIQVPDYKLQFDIKSGEQTIEFTPDKEGTVRWSCWMGMIQGKFIVKDDVSAVTASELASLPKSSGSCGCGMMKK